jgi:hypothetical protein
VICTLAFQKLKNVCARGRPDDECISSLASMLPTVSLGGVILTSSKGVLRKSIAKVKKPAEKQSADISATEQSSKVPRLNSSSDIATNRDKIAAVDNQAVTKNHGVAALDLDSEAAAFAETTKNAQQRNKTPAMSTNFDKVVFNILDFSITAQYVQPSDISRDQNQSI